jgi:serine/threonine protein kinase
VDDFQILLGVLAVRTGASAPSHVLEAALRTNGGAPLLDLLDESGAISKQSRSMLERMADNVLEAHGGDVRKVLDFLDDGLRRELAPSGLGVPSALPGSGEDIPAERPGQYSRLRVLGRGSQSIVLLARDEVVGRNVALKELAADGGESVGTRSEAAARRFIREARLVASLDHQGIVSVLELVRRHDGALVCVQKLVAGGTLKDKLAACQGLRERLLFLPNLLAAAQAVGFAHSHGVVHRDIKPSNIMVGQFGETVVVDWGLAKLRGEPTSEVPPLASGEEPDSTQTGEALGTPGYMSPEQARGAVDEIDERSDVFGLGAVLYDLLVGRRALEEGTVEGTVGVLPPSRFRQIHMQEPDAPAELVAIAEKALSSAKEDRYAAGGDFASELASLLAGGRVQAYRYGAWELLRKFASTHRPLLAGGALALAAMVVAAAVVVVRLHETRVELAGSFLERAYRAEQDGDWSKAAAYFAAARTQHDTREERWGLAAAEPRITERILSRAGPAQSFLDVAVLADGRVVTLGRGGAPGAVEVREPESALSLWTSEGGPVADADFFHGGVVRLYRTDAWTFHDVLTGRQLQRWPRSSGFPCRGVFPIAAAMHNGQLLRFDGGESRVIATDAGIDADPCTASLDFGQVAYLDRGHRLRVRSLEDGHEIASRDAEPLRGMSFGKHGLVVFRQGRLDIIGGPEGDFSIELPEARFGSWSTTPSYGGGTAVSANGELVVLAGRDGATQSVLVDLRSRSIRGLIHYPPGWPRLAFSPDGERVFAAGLRDGTVLAGWGLPADDMPRTPRWWTYGMHSQSGQTALFHDARTDRYELDRPPGTTIATGTLAFNGGTVSFVGERAAGFLSRDRGFVNLVDLELNRLLWQHPCRVCRDVSFSDDGYRVAQMGADGLELLDTHSEQLLFEDRQRVRPGTSYVKLWPDGRRVAWTYGDRLVMRDLGTGEERELPLGGVPYFLSVSPDGKRLLTITAESLTLREAESARTTWSVSKELPDRVFDTSWSPDGRAIVVTHGLSATEVLDAATGERIGWFQALRRVVTPILAELYAPDLRTKGVVAEKTWDTVPLPQPQDGPADRTLARILEKTGMEFRGVELVAAH